MRTWKKIFLIGSGIAALIAGYSSYYIIDQKEQAVITSFGKPVRVILNPIEDEYIRKKTEVIKEGYTKEGIDYAEGAGLYFKLPWHSVNRFDRRLLKWEGYPEQITTKEKKYIFVSDTTRGIIINPREYFRIIGADLQAESRITDITDSSSRTAIAERDLIEIVRTSNREMQVAEKELKENIKIGEVKEGREKVMDKIEEVIRNMCDSFGIEIHKDGYLMINVTYPNDVKESVENNMISERTRIAEKYKSEGDGEYQKTMGKIELDKKTIMSEAYKTAEAIKGEGEAGALKIYADAYNKDPDLYNFLKTLELYKKGFTKNTKLILGTDNDLLKFLKGNVQEEKKE